MKTTRGMTIWFWTMFDFSKDESCKEVYEDFLRCLQRIKDDPAFWPNNKRRMRGMGPLRKSSNDKFRTLYVRNRYASELYLACDRLLSVALPKEADNVVKSLVSVGELLIGSGCFI